MYNNSIAIGDICIGDNVKIGAGAVLLKSAPTNSLVAPAKKAELLQNN